MCELVIMAPLVAIRRGATLDRLHVPLHLTVLPNTRVPMPVADLVPAIARIASDSPCITVHALGYELFGPHRDIAVTTAEMRPPLRRLHERLSAAVGRAGGEPVMPAHHGDGYRAHVTKTLSGVSIDPGASIELRALAVVDCTDQTLHVVETVQLGQPWQLPAAP